jgi:hypothetical protein
MMKTEKVVDAEVVAGTQMAMVAAIAAILKHTAIDNPKIHHDLRMAVEQTKANLLGSNCSDKKLDAFEIVAQSLMDCAKLKS